MNVTKETSARLYVPRLLEVCVEYGKKDYGRELLEKAREKFGDDIIRSESYAGFLRSISRWLNTKEEVSTVH
jgi:hypothetical protein